jgi:hypothetical protein
MKLLDNVRISIVFLIIMTFVATAGPSFAFRCGTSLVSKGERKPEVIHKCGEPDYIDSWEEERISKDYSSGREYDPKALSYLRYRQPLLVKEYVRIDVWTYNLGPNRFIRYLIFENEILTEITIGERGY